MLVALHNGCVATIDDDDALLVSAHKWHAIAMVSKTGRQLGWYAVTRIDGRTTYMHRMIMDYPEGKQVDHADGDGLNNSRTNLRICTQSQNNANRNIDRPSSGYRGVHRHGRKWRAICGRDERGNNFYVGSFDTPIAAALAFDDAARKRFGDFAVVNFVA